MVLEPDMTESNYGPQELGNGSRRTTIIISEETSLPVQRDELTRYPDGKIRSKHSTFFDWGTPNIIEAPIAAKCRRFDLGVLKFQGPGCETKSNAVR